VVREEPVSPVSLVAPVAPAPSPQAAAAAPALEPKAHESANWVVPVLVLVGLLGSFLAIRFAYWHWAINRSRRRVVRYAVYRGTGRWGT
jgi:hypothetical protein